MSTDMAVPVSSGEVHELPSVEGMSDRELLEESVRNQRFIMATIEQVATGLNEAMKSPALGMLGKLLGGKK